MNRYRVTFEIVQELTSREILANSAREAAEKITALYGTKSDPITVIEIQKMLKIDKAFWS